MSDLHAENVESSEPKPADNAPPQVLAGTTIYEQTHADDRKQRRRRKLQKAPIWIEAACAVVLVGITGFYTHYAHQQATAAHNTLVEIQKQYPEIKKSADAAKTSADTAAKQLELSERPWIKIIDAVPAGASNPLGGLTFQEITIKGQPSRIQATIQVILRFSNIGHSVADVTPNLEFFMPQFSSSEYWNRVSKEEQRFCGSPDMSAVTTQNITLFPNEPQPFDYYSGISTPIKPENISQLPQGSGVVPSLIVCVSYRHKGLPNLYQTRAVYEVSNRQTHQRLFTIGACNIRPFANMAPFTFCQGGVPATSLKFDRNYNGDDAY